MEAVPAPHMGINDPRAPVAVRMWNTWNIRDTEPVDHIFAWTAAVARTAPGNKLGSLVICCHGAPAYLQLGEGVNPGNVGAFRALRGLVGTIYLRACLVGRIVGADTAAQGDGKCIVDQLKSTGNGHEFVVNIASNAQADVVCSTELQTSNNDVMPYGKIDSWEGLWLRYGPDGTVKVQGRNRSVRDADCGPNPTGRWVGFD